MLLTVLSADCFYLLIYIFMTGIRYQGERISSFASNVDAKGMNTIVLRFNLNIFIACRN